MDERIYRVRKLNPTVLHFFSKNAINKLIFNIFCPNLQVMFIGRYFLWLFKKIAASLNNGLNPVAGPPAGLGHGVPWEAGHDVHDLCLQWGGSVVGAPVDIPLANAPSVIMQGFAVWAAGRPYLLWQEKLWNLTVSLTLLPAHRPDMIIAQTFSS